MRTLVTCSWARFDLDREASVLGGSPFSQLNIRKTDESKIAHSGNKRSHQWPNRLKQNELHQTTNYIKLIYLRGRVSQRREDHSGVKSLTVHRTRRRRSNTHAKHQPGLPTITVQLQTYTTFMIATPRNTTR